MSFILALVVLVLDVVFWAVKGLNPELAILIGLLAVAILVGGYADVAGWVGRRPAA